MVFPKWYDKRRSCTCNDAESFPNIADASALVCLPDSTEITK